MPGRPRSYNLSEIAVWRINYEREAKTTRPEAADPMLGTDSESDALERYREAKAADAWFKLAKDAGEAVPLEEVRQFGDWIASRVSSFGERLQKKGHNDAFELLQEVLEDCQRQSDEFFSRAEEPAEA